MKETITFTVGEKEYEMGYDIKSLMKFEQLSGRTLYSLFSGGSQQSILNSFSLEITVAGLSSGLNLSLDDTYDFIDNAIENGLLIDDLNGYIMQAMLKANGFLKRKEKEEVKAEKPKTSKKKK